MSNQENNKFNCSNSSNKNSSTDKGKAKSISAISNSATTLLREALIPSSGTSSTTTLNSLLQNQKPQSSLTTIFSQVEWKNNFSQQNNVNANIRSEVNNINELGDSFDTDWKQWIPENNIQNIDIIDPCPSAKSTSYYPFHHHHPHRINYSLHENIQDGNETLDFLNSNNYTNQIYNEDFNQITSNRQKDYNFLGNSKFVLEEFLKSKDIHEYLLRTSYTDDIYGIPILLKELIIEAKNELNNQNIQDDNVTLKHQKTAIERLKMVRDHLIEKRRLTDNNNNNNNNNNDVDVDVDDELLLNNWLDKWTGIIKE